MNRQELLSLRRATARRIRDIRAEDPAAEAALSKLLAEERRNQLERIVSDAPDDVRRIVDSIDVLQEAPETLCATLQQAIEEEKMAEEVRESTLARLKDVQESIAFRGPDEETVVGTLPGLGHALELANLHVVTELCGIEEQRTEALVRIAPSLAAIGDDALSQLIEDGVLDEDEARHVGLTANLYQLTDENETLCTAIEKAEFARLPGKRITALEDLAALRKEDWYEFLSEQNVSLPEGVTVQEQARELAGRMGELFPTKAFFGRLPTVSAVELAAHLEAIAPLWEENPCVVGSSFTQLEISGTDPDELERIHATHAAVCRTAHLYPGLRLDAVLDDTDLTISQRVEETVRRVGLIERVRDEFDQTELLALDFSPGGDAAERLNLETFDLGPEDRRLVLDSFKAYQRTFALTGDVDTAQAILAAGYASSIDIGQTSREVFCSNVELDPSMAIAIHDSARSALGVSAASFGTILDAWYGGFDWLGVGNLGSDIRDHLRELDGFDDLFGRLALCDCRH